MSENTKRTQIENGTEIEGSIKSQCPVAVSGKVDGQLEAPSLTVAENGSMKGRVKVN